MILRFILLGSCDGKFKNCLYKNKLLSYYGTLVDNADKELSTSYGLTISFKNLVIS
jgi:hypothetical protein